MLRIEIYEEMTDTQIQAVKEALTEMGVTEITVERMPEEEDDEGNLILDIVNPADDEPQEDDYKTEDHIHFYQYGKLVVTVPMADGFEAEDWMPHVRAHVEKEQYFPNVWWISDHGNAHLISVLPDGRYFTEFDKHVSE